MEPFSGRNIVLLLAVFFAGLGVVFFTVAILNHRLAHMAGYVGGLLLAVAYLWALLVVWIDGKPVQMRSGALLTKHQNPVAYRITFSLLSLFGWFPILIFSANLFISHG